MGVKGLKYHIIIVSFIPLMFQYTYIRHFILFLNKLLRHFLTGLIPYVPSFFKYICSFKYFAPTRENSISVRKVFAYVIC